MKIGPHTHSFVHEPPRGAGRRSAENSSNAAAPQTAGKPEAAGSPTPIPPGLERVRARLEAMGDARNQGQSNALDRISRNIARYQETQAMASQPASSGTPQAASNTSESPAETQATPVTTATTPAAEATPPVADAGNPPLPDPAPETPAPTAA